MRRLFSLSLGFAAFLSLCEFPALAQQQVGQGKVTQSVKGMKLKVSPKQEIPGQPKMENRFSTWRTRPGRF